MNYFNPITEKEEGVRLRRFFFGFSCFFASPGPWMELRGRRGPLQLSGPGLGIAVVPGGLASVAGLASTAPGPAGEGILRGWARLGVRPGGLALEPFLLLLLLWCCLCFCPGRFSCSSFAFSVDALVAPAQAFDQG